MSQKLKISLKEKQEVNQNLFDQRFMMISEAYEKLNSFAWNTGLFEFAKIPFYNEYMEGNKIKFTGYLEEKYDMFNDNPVKLFSNLDSNRKIQFLKYLYKV